MQSGQQSQNSRTRPLIPPKPPRDLGGILERPILYFYPHKNIAFLEKKSLNEGKAGLGWPPRPDFCTPPYPLKIAISGRLGRLANRIRPPETLFLLRLGRLGRLGRLSFFF